MKSFEFGYLQQTPVTQPILRSVRTLGEHKGRQDLFKGQTPEILETLRRVSVVESVESSNRIEGIDVGHKRVEEIVARKTKPTDRPGQEVAGYRDVLAEIHDRHGTLRLSTDLILDWHRKLYRFTGGRGEGWKTEDNAILEVRPDGRQVVRFRPVSAAETPEFMDRLVTECNGAMASVEVEPLLTIASFILDFLCIHPFSDGNGRIGRLLTLLLLYHNGYEVGRYISLERVVEESKETYYESLHRSSRQWHEGEHDLRPWWEYFLGTLTAAYKEFESRVGTFLPARGAKREMVKRAVEMLPGRFAMADLERLCPGISRPTIHRALEELKQHRLVRCIGRGFSAHWERTEKEIITPADTSPTSGSLPV
jgi:Fic family protein